MWLKTDFMGEGHIFDLVNNAKALLSDVQTLFDYYNMDEIMLVVTLA